MHDLGETSMVVAQGVADPYSKRFADHLDPMRHLERYRSGTATTFELGQDDRHIPEQNGRAFVEALQGVATAPQGRLRIQLHPGLDHLGVTTSDAAMGEAADWLVHQ